MRLIYLHQYFTTPAHMGGCRSYEFARRLVARGHSVDMVTSTAFFPARKRKWWHFITKVEVDGICVHAIHTRYSNRMSFTRRLVAFSIYMVVASFYVCLLRQRDVIFATSTPLSIGVPALVGRWALGAPLVFEVRDLWPDIPVAMGYIRHPWLKKLLYRFERLIYSKAERIVTLSPGMEEGLRRKGVESQRIVMVPNASDIEMFSVNGESDPFSLYRDSSDVRICLYAGTFGYVNDVGYLVELAARLRVVDSRIRIVLLGDGVERDHILSAIRENELEGHVVMLDPVRRAELPRYLAAADACFSTVRPIPALYDNSANKFFDSLAAGKPVIINHGGWQAEVIEKHRLGIVLDHDMENSARRLSRFLDDIAGSSIEGHVREFARQHYDRDRLFERWLTCGVESVHGNRV